jgi:hypothetical protein
MIATRLNLASRRFGAHGYVSQREAARSIGTALSLLFLGAALGCGSAPEINDVSIDPANFQLSGITNNVTFEVSCNVLHFGASISSVVASVEGQSIMITLAKTGGAPGDEQWSGADQETLFSAFSAGVYQVDVTATDTNGMTATNKGAASVTLTN